MEYMEINKFAETIMRELIDDPEKLSVTNMVESDQNVILSVQIPKDYVGQVMGKNGHLLNAIKRILSSAYSARGKKHRSFTIEFLQTD